MKINFEYLGVLVAMKATVIQAVVILHSTLRLYQA
jgi:hypothetical protein